MVISSRLGSAELAGVHTALATPIGPDGELDLTGLHRLLDHVCAGRVDAICPTGSTGEGPRLTRAQRRSVLRAVRDHLGTDRMIIPAASAMTVSDAIQEIAALAEDGAAAVLLAPPSYYPMPPADQVRWYAAIAAQAAIPVVLYNIPAMTTVSIAPESLSRLAELPGVIGMKDSSRDLEYLQHAVLATEDADFAVLTGTDTLLQSALDLGAVGTIAASGNLVPQLCRAILDAFSGGDPAMARAAQRRVVAVVDACRVGTPPAGWKAALAWAGICRADLVPPAGGLNPEQRGRLEVRLNELQEEIRWRPDSTDISAERAT